MAGRGRRSGADTIAVAMSDATPKVGRDAYKQAGVDYETLDAGKRDAVAAALATSDLLLARGGRALDGSRGSPAFVLELAGRRLAFVLECLGTKSIVARQVYEQLGVNRFADVAYDTVAAIVGDLCCVGAAPAVVNAYFATGSSQWYAQHELAQALIEGWSRACVDAGCVWGGGESPSLTGLVAEREIELAGSAVGVIPDGIEPILGEHLGAGDEIVLVASTGLHANGVSVARMVAGRLPDGYATAIASGRQLGDAVLDPSALYSPLVEALLADALVPTYISHITGHGLLKLMRSPKELTYRIAQLPPVPEVLQFLVDEAKMDAPTAYSTFNMGVGLALCARPGTGTAVQAVAQAAGFEATLAGTVEAGERQVILEPVGVHFAGSQLDLGGRA